MAQFAFTKKSKETEPFVSFLPRVVPEPNLVLNFSATALRNSAVRIVQLGAFVSDAKPVAFRSLYLEVCFRRN